MANYRPPRPGYRFIYRPYITKNGARIYPKKSKYFKLEVKI